MPRTFTPEQRQQALETRRANRAADIMDKHWPGTLEERYKDDPDLFNLYKNKLLIRGWAGHLDDCEKRYIESKGGYTHYIGDEGRYIPIKRRPDPPTESHQM